MAIDRIEVYLDDAPQPMQVLTQSPFNVKLDTRSLADGEHNLKVVTQYRNGSRDIRTIPFKVANTPGVLVQGLDSGKEVSGELDLTLRVADPEVKATAAPFPGLALAVTTAVLLLGLWGFFALTGSTNEAVSEIAANAKAGGEETKEAAAAGPAAAVDAALLKKGEGVYTANCAGCHQATGAGLPGAFPPLAGNANLSDVKHVTTVIHQGLKGEIEAKGQKYNGQMPPFAQLSDDDVAAVATYVRNSWGNKFGGVTAEDSKATR